MSTPDTVTPASRPPRVSGPKMNPTATGVSTASRPGSTMRRMAALVEISTHRAYSGLPLAASKTSRSSRVHSPSSFPSFFLITDSAALSSGMALNCRRTSSIMAMAAWPTAFMARAENRKGSMPPTKSPAMTRGLAMSMVEMPTCTM